MSRRSLAVLSLCAAVAAQTPQPTGTLLRANANLFTRGGAGLGPGELLQRFDSELVTGFGTDPQQPQVQWVDGVLLQCLDFGSNVPDGRFTVTLYTEDPVRSGYPDLAQPLGSQPGVLCTVPAFSNLPVFFAAPLATPAGRDLFVGVRINATTSNYFGTRLNVLTSTTTNSVYDLAGPGLPASPPEQASFQLFRNLASNTLTYQSRGQYMIDLLVRGPSGAPTAITNQPHYPISNPIGTTSMLSGNHPDAASPPANAGRADDVGYLFRDVDLPAGSAVVFLAAFAPLAAPVPLAQFVPGSVGSSCLDPRVQFALGVATTGPGLDAAFLTSIPGPARLMVRGLSFGQQAIGLTATGSLRGAPCGLQRL